jgi:hypothetical protein
MSSGRTKVLLLVSCGIGVASGIQRVLGGTSKHDISFANLDDQKRKIELYTYIMISIGVLLLVALSTKLCFLLGAKSDTKKRIHAESSRKDGGGNAGAVGPESDSSATAPSSSTFGRIFSSSPRKEGDADPSRDASPAAKAAAASPEAAGDSNKQRRKLLLSNKGQIKRHVSHHEEDMGELINDNNTAAIMMSEMTQQDLPPVVPPEAENRPRRKMKMKMGSRGVKFE